MVTKILSLIKKEFISIWKDPKSRALIIVPPLLQLFVFANAITLEIKNLDIAILDRSQTLESRELISRFQHSIWFRNFLYVQNEQELRKSIETQKAQIAIEIANDFAKNIHSNKTTSVQIVVDGRQTNTASIANGYAGEIITDYNKTLKKNNKAQVDFVIRNWFNPNLEYKWFLLISLIAMLSLMISVLLTSMSIARERELGTFDQLLVSPLTSFEILVGKTVPPLIISLILTLFMTVVSMLFFKVPFVGSKILFLFSTICALLAIIGVGLFISSLCSTQQQAILGVFVFQMPSVLMSGFVSPVEDMPKILQFIDLFNPIKYYMTISKGIFLKAMGFQEVFKNTVCLILIAFVTLSIASWIFEKKLD